MFLRSNRQAFIYTVAKDKKRLMEKFGAKYCVIADALLFRSNSALARRIRSYALNYLKCTPMNMKFA